MDLLLMPLQVIFMSNILDVYANIAMGVCAEKTASDMKLTRQL